MGIEGLIVALIIGAIAGWLAGMVVKGGGFGLIGDIVVGKHVGRMMGALGGRMNAYREGFASGDLTPALVRNLYRGKDPAPEAIAHVTRALTALHDSLGKASIESLAAGELP